MESLDMGPRPRSREQRRRLAVLAAVTAGVVGLAGVIVYTNSAADSSGPQPSPTPTSPSPSRTTASSPPASPSASSASPVQRWRIRGFLTDTDLDLFARSDDHLYRIQTKKQVVTATPTPGIESGGALMFVVDRRQVILRAWGSPAPGVRVEDGRPAKDLPEALTTPDRVLPGPPGRLWLTHQREKTPITRLTDLEGRAVRAAEGPSTYEFDSVEPDGQGGLFLPAPGGYYALTPDGARRLTRGSVLAKGASHLLAADCNDALRCSRYLVDRQTGKHRRIGPAQVTDGGGSGTLSDDGRYAALWSWTLSGLSELHIIDLEKNTRLARYEDANGGADAGSLIWLPDGRLIGVLSGELFVFDPATAELTKPRLRLTGLHQLSVRPPR